MTLTEVLLVVALVLVAIAILLPVLSTMRRADRHALNMSQLRDIHRGFVTWAKSNKIGGSGVHFPGLDAASGVIPDGPLTGHSGDGAVPAARMWMMLDGNFFTPESMINPDDTHAVALRISLGGTIPPVNSENFSYAFQSLTGHPAERDEWTETLNFAIPIMGDRAIGTDPADISSITTDSGSGRWQGAVVRNDSTVIYKKRHTFGSTKYGDEPANPIDDLFQDDPAAADAFLVHDDATTAYSAK